MKLTVIIPIYNEKETIKALLNKVQSVNFNKEIIIVDDGSTDGSRELIKQLKDPNIKVYFHEKNQGKGAAIRTAIRHASGDIIIIQDADLEYDPQDYYKLIEPIKKGEADVVYGSRFLGNNPLSYSRFYWGGRFLSWLTNILYSCYITDEPTCYKMFKSEVLKSLDLKCKGFEFCPEVTAKVCRRGIKILEIPISYKPRSIEQGKKIRWIDGLIAIWTILKYRFVK